MYTKLQNTKSAAAKRIRWSSLTTTLTTWLFVHLFFCGYALADQVNDQQHYEQELKEKLIEYENKRIANPSEKYHFDLSLIPYEIDRKALKTTLKTALANGDFESIFDALKKDSVTITQKSDQKYRAWVHRYQNRNSAYKIAKAILDNDDEALSTALENPDDSLAEEVFIGDVLNNTPLYLAIRANNLTALKALLDAGVNPDLLGKESSSTPLSEAEYIDNWNAVNLLLDAGANVDTVVFGSGSKPTLLSLSVRHNNTELITRLLNSDANPNIVDHFGWTPLMDAIHTQNWGHFERLLPLTDASVKSTKKIKVGNHRKPLDRSYPLTDALSIAEQINSPLGERFRNAIKARLEE